MPDISTEELENRDGQNVIDEIGFSLRAKNFVYWTFAINIKYLFWQARKMLISFSGLHFDDSNSQKPIKNFAFVEKPSFCI